MNANETLTKTQIFDRINVLRSAMDKQHLAAYKASDLSKDQLFELLDLEEQDFEDFSATSFEEQLVGYTIIEERAADPNDDAYGAYVEATEPSIGRAAETRKSKRAPLYNEQGLRRCGCCGHYFHVEAFGNYKPAKDGLANYTKDHTAEYRKAKKASKI